MQDFTSEFRNLDYVLRHAERILLFAHTRPDADTAGSNIALERYLRSLGKTADIACYDPMPDFAKKLFPETRFVDPEKVRPGDYDAFIASDSINRGFDRFRKRLDDEPVIVLIDHHPIEEAEGDIVIIDPTVSSAAEIVYAFLKSTQTRLSKDMATGLLLGILGDTGHLQHSSTGTGTFAAASDLIQSGAALSKITSAAFSDNKLTTLQLWGKALSRAKINPKNGMIYAAITGDDIRELGNPSTDDLYIASELLNHVPDARFSLLFYQLDDDTVRGSLRTEPHKHIDVSSIAKTLGGGGHRYASGFEIPGRILETPDGWEIC